MCSLLAFMSLLPVSTPAYGAWSDSDGVYYLKTTDGLEPAYTVDGSMRFVSQSGVTIAGFRDCGVVFTPASAGEVITVTVQEIDLDGGNYLLAYDGAIEGIKSGMSDGVNQSRYLPDGWVKKFVKGDAGATYTSAASDGSLSLAFHSGSSGGQKGFALTVESVSLKDMEYVGAESMLPAAAPRRGQDDARLQCIQIVADGSSNPLSIDNLTLDCSALVSNPYLSDIRLVKGGEVLARLDAGTSELSVTGIGLRTGKNELYVIADIATDASGAVPSAGVKALTVGGAVRPVPGLPAATAEFANEIWMPSTHLTFTVGEPLRFYDDGGADGKIGSKFEGIVTFVPATAGEAVKIDFAKLEIFNTSSTGMNDILTVYNGREADNANLIATLLKEPEIVKSTADDGSLTVKLVSTTGNPANGWEATVSQFLPGDMTLTAVNVTDGAPEGATVSASQETAPMLLVDFIADNTASPLEVTSFGLTTDTPGLIKAIRINHLGKKADMQPGVLFGSAQVDGGSVTVGGTAALAEGHNWFAITADIDPGALNDSRVALALGQAVVGGVMKTPDSGEGVSRTVRNVYHSAEGTRTVTVYDTWRFQPTYNTSPGYQDRYAGGQTDQTVTFVPAAEGEVIQIDFDSFDLYYSDSYNGATKAKFEVYSGSACDENALLWKLAGTADKTAGPGRTLRSASADGAMTIRFNPNTSSSYYCATGWDAAVKPFRNHDMTIEAVRVERGNTSEMPVGGLNQELLGFTMETEGTLSVKTLKSVQLAVEGAEALAKVKILTWSKSDESDIAEFGETDAVAAETTVGGELSLSEGLRYFRVVADVRPDAEAETAVRVGLMSVVDKDGDRDVVENGNPEGSRIVKNVMYLEAGEHVQTVSRPLMWYDDGGADGKITSRISATYTFVPDREGYAVTLDATQFSIGNGKMYVYSGREADDDARLGTVTGYGTTNGPTGLVSKAADGSLTVTVTGPSGSTLDGFAIQVGLHEKTDYVLESLSGESAGKESDCLRGSRDLPLLKAVARITGDQGESKISRLGFSLAGTDAITDVKALRLWYGGASGGFSPAICRELASAVPVSDEVMFDVAVEPADNGKYYFFLTADISDTAEAGHNVSARLTSALFNGATARVMPYTSAATVKAGLKGIFTIGQSDADYADFGSATQALAQGVEGPVTFEILDGTYAECLKVNGVKGTSAEHPVVFRSKSGNRDAVRITGKYVASDKSGIIQVAESPYVALENVTVDAGSQNFENVVYVGERSRGFRMSGCAVGAAVITTSAYSGTRLIYSHPVNEADGNNDFMTVENSTFDGGYVAMYLGGTGYVGLPKEKGLVIRGNTIRDSHAKGIYLSNEENPVVEGNTVMWNGTKKGYQGMDLYRISGGATIGANRILNKGAAYSTGIDLRDECAGTAESPVRIFNNEVILTKSENYSGRALNIANACRNVDVDYNTLRVGGTGAYVMATNGKGTPSVRVRGNIFDNECTDTSIAVYFWNSTDTGGFSFAGNAWWSAGKTLCKNDSQLLGFEEFRTLTGDNSAVSARPQFVSEMDSHLAEPGEMRAGTAVEGITADIEGRDRPASGLTFGAYEYSAPTVDAPAIAEGYPRVSDVAEASAVVRTKWNMGGELHYVVTEWNDQAAIPVADEVAAGTAVQILADTESVVNLSALESETTYRVHFVAVSAAGVRSEVVSTPSFTTLRHIGPLAVAFGQEETPRVESGSNYVLEPIVTGGDLPYTYVWTDQLGRNVGESATLTISPEVSAVYRLKVISADGQTAEASTAVEVTGAMVAATFDDNYVEANSHIIPATSEERFYSGSFAFNAGGMPAYNFWYGYALTSETSPQFSTLDDQFRSSVGGAYSGTNFAVSYPQGLTIDVTNNPEGEVIPGFYVTNSAYAYSSMTNGDGFAKKFGEGDWFKLTATGKCADGSSKTVDFYLADMRDSAEAERYIVDTWEWMDLRSLGKVTSVSFTFDSSDKGTYGVNTPTYFCLDDFGTMPHAETFRVSVTDGKPADISRYFTPDAGSQAGVVYSIEPLEELPFLLRVENGNLWLDRKTRAGDDKKDYACLASMRQGGRTQYVNLLVSEGNKTGIESVGEDAVRIYPVPVRDRMNVLTGLTDYTVDIYSTAGACVFHSDGNDGDIVIRRDGWSDGIYIVRISSAESTVVKRIVVK